MRKIIKIGCCILAALIVLPPAIFFGYPLMVAMSGHVFAPPVHQEVANIESIEILDTSLRQEDVLYTLEDSQIQPFMDVLLGMKSARYVNDPPDRYGDYAVRITYLDGSIDTIGTLICAYHSPDGRDESYGWYYVDRDKLMDLIDDYVDPVG